eukprot:s1635_g8.t1
MQETMRTYQNWLASTPLERLRLAAPQPNLEHVGHPQEVKRLEQRATTLLLGAIPDDIKGDLISQTKMWPAAIMYKILRTYCPGGWRERTQLLQELATTTAAKDAVSAASTLRLWKRQRARALEVGASLPDLMIQVKALDTIVMNVLHKQHLELIMAEMDYISHSVGTPQEKVKVLQGSPQRGKQDRPCKYWGTANGCKHGPQCRFTHGPLPAKDGVERCWHCSAPGHRKPDCPALGEDWGESAAWWSKSKPWWQWRGQKGRKRSTKRVSTLIKTIKTEGNKDAAQLKVISLKRLEHDPDGAVLLDSGATHGLRQPRSEREWKSAVDTQVENDMGKQLRALHLGLPDDAVMVSKDELQRWFPEAPMDQINKLVVPKAINAGEVPFNRHFRKRIQKATAVVLNLFCGPNPKWWEKKMPPGVEIINIDLLVGQDLLHDGLFSYTCSRMRDDNGPRMLRARSGEHRWGLPHLKPWEQQQVWSDSQLWLRTLVLARVSKQYNPNMLSIFEQPAAPATYIKDLPEEPPTFSIWPELVDTLEGVLALDKVLLDQGALGHVRRKPTVLWSNMEPVVALHGLHDRRASQPWPSNLEEALNLSKDLAAWSEGLKRAIVTAIADAAKTPGAAVRMTQLAEWYQHLAQDHFPYRRDCYECVQAAGRDQLRRHIEHPEAWLLSFDVAGPFAAGRDHDRVHPRYMLCANLTVPVLNELPLIDGWAPKGFTPSDPPDALADVELRDDDVNPFKGELPAPAEQPPPDEVAVPDQPAQQDPQDLQQLPLDAPAAQGPQGPDVVVAAVDADAVGEANLKSQVADLQQLKVVNVPLAVPLVNRRENVVLEAASVCLSRCVSLRGFFRSGQCLARKTCCPCHSRVEVLMLTIVISMPIAHLLSFFLLGAGMSCPNQESDMSTLLQPLPQNTPELTALSWGKDAYDTFVELERARVGKMMGPLEDSMMSPCMTKEEFDLYYDKISKADVYFEFGTGGSTTVAAACKNLRCLKSIENSMEWIDTVSKQPSVSAAIAEGRLELVYVDIGETGEWGYPVSDSTNPSKLRNYSDQTFGTCGSRARQRVVLVDGRYRVACFLKMLASLAAIDPQEALATQMLMHDYERTYYHVVEAFADLIEMRGRLAVFRMKPQANLTALKETALRYELVAE